MQTSYSLWRLGWVYGTVLRPVTMMIWGTILVIT